MKKGRKVKEFQSKKRYLASFVIGTLLFLLIIGLSYSIAIYQYTKVSDVQGSTAYSLLEKKISYTFFDDDICSVKRFEEISTSLGEQGKVLEDLENKFGRNNVQVLERKRFYSVLLLEHLDYTQTYNEQCQDYKDSLLFFYSNVGNLDASEKAGRVLDSVNSENDVFIYSFDLDLDSIIIQELKEKYDIESSPTIVINGEEKLMWPFSKEKIEDFLVN